ncbi:zinc finger CCCH domain-containing protein 11A-like [Oncorhynchus kisutch]|uniref:zinc finger CCCH domain-containing protein 11A-like n=1 Tax=Oncorhynchus kisutch TaxID=8019 RepID=UPI0012DD9135|nr:zinc finger CCCH domain-containing protein 11A-like [Oncorhynchus kisutch]
MTNHGDGCYFFFNTTCAKGDSCPFRHCEAAKGSNFVCSLWQERRCSQQVSMFCHMQIKVNRKEIACYFETQPAGCQKQHCAFHHDKPHFIEANPQLRGVIKTETQVNVPRPTNLPVVINRADDVEDEDAQSYSSKIPSSKIPSTTLQLKDPQLKDTQHKATAQRYPAQSYSSKIPISKIPSTTLQLKDPRLKDTQHKATAQRYPSQRYPAQSYSSKIPSSKIPSTKLQLKDPQLKDSQHKATAQRSPAQRSPAQSYSSKIPISKIPSTKLQLKDPKLKDTQHKATAQRYPAQRYPAQSYSSKIPSTKLQLKDPQLKDTQHKATAQRSPAQRSPAQSYSSKIPSSKIPSTKLQLKDPQLKDTQHKATAQRYPAQRYPAQRFPAQSYSSKIPSSKIPSTKLQLKDTQLKDTQLKDTQRKYTQLKGTMEQPFKKLDEDQGPIPSLMKTKQPAVEAIPGNSQGPTHLNMPSRRALHVGGVKVKTLEEIHREKAARMQAQGQEASNGKILGSASDSGKGEASQATAAGESRPPSANQRAPLRQNLHRNSPQTPPPPEGEDYALCHSDGQPTGHVLAPLITLEAPAPAPKVPLCQHITLKPKVAPPVLCASPQQGSPLRQAEADPPSLSPRSSSTAPGKRKRGSTGSASPPKKSALTAAAFPGPSVDEAPVEKAPDGAQNKSPERATKVSLLKELIYAAMPIIAVLV